MVVKEIAPPRVQTKAPLQMLITNLDYDEHKGRIAIGRITSGRIARGQQVVICKPEANSRNGKVSELFVYDNFSRAPVDSVEAGDIAAVCGLSDVSIGETLCVSEAVRPLPTITVEEPTGEEKCAFVTNCATLSLRTNKRLCLEVCMCVLISFFFKSDTLCLLRS